MWWLANVADVRIHAQTRQSPLARHAEELPRLIALPATAYLARAERAGQSHLEFLHQLIGAQAAQRRERSIAHRVREACFREVKTLATFDWQFNAKAIKRTQVEELASGEFIRRHDNLVVVGQSGVEKSHIVQALGLQACALGLRVHYKTSAALLSDLRTSLADQTL